MTYSPLRLLLILFLSASLAGGLGACATQQPDKPAEPAQPKPVKKTPVPQPVPEPTGPPPGMTEDGKIAIGLLVPLSGPQAGLGEALRNAAEMALFDMADSDLALIVEDTGGTAAGARQGAEALMREGVALIMGPLFSGSAEAVAPVARLRDVPVIAFSNDPSIAGPGLFAAGLSPRAQVQRVVRYAARQEIERFAALAPDTRYGRLTVDALREAVTRAEGARMTRVAYYAPEAADVSDTVRVFADYDERRRKLEQKRRQLREAGTSAAKAALERLEVRETVAETDYDAVLIPEGGRRLTAVASLLPYYDIDPPAVRFLGTALWADPTLGREPALVGGWFAAPEPEPWQEFAARYEEYYGEAPPRLASLGYDVMAVAAVLGRGQARDFDPQRVYSMEALTQPSGFFGVDGIFRLRADGMVERGLAVIEITEEGLNVLEPAPQSFDLVVN